MKHMQKYLWQLLLCAIGIGLVWVFFEATPQLRGGATPLETTYRVEGRLITFVNGQNEFEVAPGSATVVKTRVFGEPALGDLNNDGRPDAAMFLVQEPGGTGTFYYLATAVSTGRGYRGTNAIFLGDRIAPQTVEIRNGLAIANYAERRPDEPFVVQPSIGRSLYAQLQGAATLVDVSAQVTGQQY